MRSDAVRLEISRVSESARRRKGPHNSVRDISRLEELRDEEIARCEQKVVRCAEKETSKLEELRVASRIATEPGPRHLSPWPTH